MNFFIFVNRKSQIYVYPMNRPLPRTQAAPTLASVNNWGSLCVRDHVEMHRWHFSDTWHVIGKFNENTACHLPVVFSVSSSHTTFRCITTTITNTNFLMGRRGVSDRRGFLCSRGLSLGWFVFQRYRMSNPHLRFACRVSRDVFKVPYNAVTIIIFKENQVGATGYLSLFRSHYATTTTRPELRRLVLSAPLK